MDITQKPKKRTSFFTLSIIVILLCSIGGYMIYILRGVELTYDEIKLSDTGSVATIELPETDKKLNIPSWQPFTPSGTWLYVSSSKFLNKSFTPSNLVNTALPHGDADTAMQLQSTIEKPLEKLFAASKNAGHSLMISSAYRSINDQQTLYDEFVAAKGEAQAKLYVATPGASEHHTGLSVDISDETKKCGLDSDACGLSPETAVWLSENAASYGFIQRYPEGKKSITGIAFEPWHYRFVGIPMAKAIASSGLTFDEVVKQIAPGYGPRQIE